MKIVSQSADELVLSEGRGQGMTVGVALAAGGVAIGFAIRHSTPYAPWIGLGLVAIGVAIVCLASAITMDANKANGQILYQKKRLIGTKSTSYAIADVLRIETRKQWHYENTPPGANREAGPPREPVLVAQSVIVFKSGQELALDHQKTSSTTQIGPAVLMSGQGKESAMANRVAEFLGVPFQEIAPPAMGMGMGGVNIQF